MPRKYNFSAGPAMLPEAVLKQAQEELPDWHGCGASIMEMSHRGKEFVSVHEEAEKDVRELIGQCHLTSPCLDSCSWITEM